MSKTVLITGAARGIGRAIAERLAKDGWRLILNYHHSEDAARTLAAALTDNGADVMLYQADVSDATAAHAMVTDAVQRFDGIDALVNNAGIAQTRLFTDITDEEWRVMQAVHVDGAFNCCKAVLPYMIRNHRGSIVNITSVWGLTGASCEVHYSAAKAALIGMTKALAKEVGPSGITVNAVAPGVIQTDMLRGYTAADLESLCDDTPLCRLGTPADVAGVVAFLLSDDASFITGETLRVDGGFCI